jgi:hypothetical protein
MPRPCKNLKTLVVVAAISLLIPIETTGQSKGPNAPDSLSFQGFLADSLGVPIDSMVDLTIKLYKDGSPIWTQTNVDVPVLNGVFNIILGGVGGESLESVAFSEAMELGVTLGGLELLPRTPLTASAFALGLRGLYVVDATSTFFAGPNVVGGSRHNIVGADAVGATVFGGGESATDGTPRPNSVDAIYPTVSGGTFNSATDNWATVGGGNGNQATGNSSTIGGGASNSASLDGATVGGGGGNSAQGIYATVAGGDGNLARGSDATVGGGASNLASSDYSTIPGGFSNQVRGQYGFAAGSRTRVNHDGSFAWSDRSLTALQDTLHTTGDNQFLIRANGGVGIGTNSPEEQLHVLKPSGGSGLRLGGDGTDGPHGIIFDDDVAGNGVQLLWRTDPNELIIERTSQGTTTNGTDVFVYDRDNDKFRFLVPVGVGTSNPVTQFHVAKSVSAAASTSNHVALIDNTSNGSSADVLALRVARVDTPGTSNAYISFKFNGNSSAGFIRGNGSGVEFFSYGSDYAEYLRQINPAEVLEPGDVVGVFAGRITRRTEGADQVMVVSTAPILVGNGRQLKDADEEGAQKIAFIGQAPVKVRGPAQTGDMLIPSGYEDGTAVAISPTQILPEQLPLVFGTTWESGTSTGIQKINAAIGIDQTAAAGEVIQALHERQSRLEDAVQILVERLAVVEARMTN